MENSRFGIVAATVLLAALTMGRTANATDQGITGKKLLLKSTPKLVLLSKDASISVIGSDPVGGSDSSITFDDGINSATYSLPASGWSANGAGTLLKYKNAAAPGGPSAVKIAKLKSGLLKVVAKGIPFPVPSGEATVDVVLSLDGGSNTYCMTFAGTGDGSKFLVKAETTAGSCGTPASCGNNTREGTEACDGSDASACPSMCQPDCTCPTQTCGNNTREGTEECDGSDATACVGSCNADCTCSGSASCGNNVREGTEECDGSDGGGCPGLCQSNCTCPPTGEVCCEMATECRSAPSAGFCHNIFRGTAVGNGAVCDGTGNCVPPPGSRGGCCENSALGEDYCSASTTQTSCEFNNGTFHYSVCHPNGTCICSDGGVLVGDSCWYFGGYADSCDAVCAALGKTCSAATMDYAGSAGTDQNCRTILTALGWQGAQAEISDCGGVPAGKGCIAFGTCEIIGGCTGQGWSRCTSPATTCAAVPGSVLCNIGGYCEHRACACE